MMPAPARSFLIALMALAGAACPASAQLLQPADPGSTPGWVFTPSVAFSTAWDDNVALSGHRAPTASDTIMQFSPSAELQYRARHQWVAFAYTGSIARYQTLTELNSYDQQLRLDSRFQLARRVALVVHDGLAFTPTTDAVMVSGVPFFRTGSRLNDGRADLQVAVTAHTTLSAGYDIEWVSFNQDSPFAPYLKGGIAQGGNVRIVHELTQRLGIGATYTRRRATVSNGGGHFDMDDGAGTFHYLARQGLSVSGALGFSRLTGGTEVASGSPSRATTPVVARTGLSWNFAAEQRLERATISASYSRSFVPSFGLGGTIQNEEVDGNLRMPVSRNRVYWQIGVSWRRNEPITAGEQRLRSLWLQTTVGYGVRRWLRVEGYYWRSQQDSRLPGGRVDRNRIGIQLVAATPVRVQ